MSDLEKRDKAIRLFEAMSGVDEKYLEACENSGAAMGETAKKGKVVSFQKFARIASRYGKYVAAVLVLCVLGMGYYAVQHTGSKTTENCADAGQMVALMPMDNEMNGAPEEAPAEALAEVMPEAVAEVEDGVVPGQTGNGMDMVGLKWEEGLAKPAVGSEEWLQELLPTVWPENSIPQIQYMVACGTQSKGSFACVASAEKEQATAFTLTLTDWEDGVPEDRDAAYILASELTLEEIASMRGETAEDVSVLYEKDGHSVLIKYHGEGTAEEIYQMFASIPEE